jgi:hypothetical protein
LLFDNIQQLLVALMQGVLAHCPELVEVNFFFLVQLAETLKKDSSPAATAQARRCASTVRVGDGRVRVHVLDANRECAQQRAAETKTPESAVFLVRPD